jgi:hypothetical protein
LRLCDSTTQRHGWTAKPSCSGGLRTISMAMRVAGGVGLQVVRDWVLRFNAEGPAGLIDRKAPGPAPLLKDEHRVMA